MLSSFWVSANREQEATAKAKARTLAGVRDLDALAVSAAELPAVERALQALAHHLPAGAQVGAQVRTVRVQHVRHAVVVAKHGQGEA